MTAEQCTPAVKGEGTPIANYTMPRIWDELSISSKFEARQAEVDAFNNANRWKKRGIAMSPMRYGLGHGHVAGSNCTINVHASDGSVEVFHSGQEMGQGLTTKCQVRRCCLQYTHDGHPWRRARCTSVILG